MAENKHTIFLTTHFSVWYLPGQPVEPFNHNSAHESQTFPTCGYRRVLLTLHATVVQSLKTWEVGQPMNVQAYLTQLKTAWQLLNEQHQTILSN